MTGLRRIPLLVALLAPVPTLAQAVGTGVSVPASVALAAPKTLAEYKKQLVRIPGGSFQMGAVPVEYGNPDKQPVHLVRVDAFKMGRTPVTVAMFKEFCAATGRTMPKAPGWGWIDDHPMVNVTWEEAVAFATWAELRLPTEAEWEYAARGGEFGRTFPWGESYEDTKAWSSVLTPRDRTVPVSRADHIFINPYGLSDMAGNVFQWCSDWYGADYYAQSPEFNPRGPDKGEFRVLRGASWYSSNFINSLRCAGRASSHPAGRGDTDGFRLVQSVKP